MGSIYSILVDDTSKKIARSTSSKLRELNVGDDAMVDYWQVEILEENNHSEYTSGQCFLNLQAALNRTLKKPKALNAKKEEEIIDPFAPTNGIDLSKVELEIGDLLIYNNGRDHFAYLESFLATKLQKHQVKGVEFMYHSINKLNGNNIYGCILADMMGLGKTIQAIALIWIMLKKCKFTEVRRARKALVVAPSSLLYHW